MMYVVILIACWYIDPTGSLSSSHIISIYQVIHIFYHLSFTLTKWLLGVDKFLENFILFPSSTANCSLYLRGSTQFFNGLNSVHAFKLLTLLSVGMQSHLAMVHGEIYSCQHFCGLSFSATIFMKYLKLIYTVVGYISSPTTVVVSLLYFFIEL